MRRLAGLCLIAVLGCQEEKASDPALSEKPGKRQVDLAGKIFTAVPDLEKLGPEAEADAGLALAQIIVPGYAARLRLFVAEDHPAVAKGAAVALVGIRLVGETNTDQVLAECIKTETIQAMRDECSTRTLSVIVTYKLEKGSVEAALDSDEVEKRRKALREILKGKGGAVNDTMLGKLIHLLNDPDPQVKVLTYGVLLRESLEKNPLPPEPK